jgi:hypothetical protein
LECQAGQGGTGTEFNLKLRPTTTSIWSRKDDKIAGLVVGRVLSM